jgi:ERCC4-type nuclease
VAVIEAVLVDSREPAWVQGLTFGGVLVSVMQLDSGDVQAVTKDGCLLSIERKTADDLINTLRDERLFPQMARLAEPRMDQQLAGQALTYWPYLVITGHLQPGPNGKVVTERGETGWAYSAIQGALLSIQEMGVFVVQCEGDQNFEQCVLSLGKRSRKDIQKILPPRPGMMMGPGLALLASLPGIGPEKAIELMHWADNLPGHAIAGLTDLEIPAPVGESLRKRIRQVLGLKDNQNLDIWMNQKDQEILKVLEKTGG